MNVPVQLETRLTVLAHSTGRPANALLCEAIERYADQEERFLAAVDKGLVAANRDEFVDDKDVLRWLEEREHS